MTDEARTYVLDRIEDSMAVLTPEDSNAEEYVEISQLPRGTREGSVLRVTESGGKPLWTTATLDEARRQELINKAEETLRELRDRDLGGDIVL